MKPIGQKGNSVDLGIYCIQSAVAQLLDYYPVETSICDGLAQMFLILPGPLLHVRVHRPSLSLEESHGLKRVSPNGTFAILHGCPR